MLWNGLREFRRKVGEVGLGYASFILFKSILPARILAMNAFLISENLIEPLTLAPDPEIHFRPITEQDQEALSEFDEYVSDVSQELAEGAIGFVLEKNGQIIASDWYAKRDITLFGWAVLKLPPDSINNLFMTVRPGHRGHGYHRSIKERSLDTFARQGITRKLSVVEAANRNSRRASARTGGTFIGRILYLRLLDWKLLRYKSTWHAGRWTKDTPLVLEI